MCKVVAFTNAKKLDPKKSAEVIGKILLDLEGDGFGYAIQGATNAFGERCIADDFTYRHGSKSVVTLPIVEVRQSSFGRAEAPAGPAIFHGRTSTNDRGLLNCHPMTRESWHLIHNGVVSDHGKPYLKLTTNDSEDVLHRLIQGIDHVERDLSGYYAFAAIDPKGQLHVARDTNATLYVAWSPKISSYVFATTSELLVDISKGLGLKVGPIDKVKGDVYMIFNGNDSKHLQAIKPRGYDTRQAAFAEASLGKSLDYKLTAADYDDDWNRATVYDASTSRFNDAGAEDLMQELADMTDDYDIEDYEGEPMSVEAYHKLDEISKAECTIWRPDGTVMELEGAMDDYNSLRKA